MLNYNKELKVLARELRKNMTDAEKLLWAKVRRKQFRGCQFYRQAIIDEYIVDFYCPQSKLVVEIDGGQHYYGDRLQNDKIRDRHLARLGLIVLRYSNYEVLQNIDMVLENIYEKLNPPAFGLTEGVTSMKMLIRYQPIPTNSSDLSELFPFAKGGK
jgi:very-short-patch-repair endonuclease